MKQKNSNNNEKIQSSEDRIDFVPLKTNEKIEENKKPDLKDKNIEAIDAPLNKVNQINKKQQKRKSIDSRNLNNNANKVTKNYWTPDNSKIFSSLESTQTSMSISSRKKFRLLPWASQSKINNGSPAVVSITYEEIGLFPRSFSRVFDRFIKQVFSDVENLVIQEYRFYRYLFLTTLQCLFILLFIPFLVNLVAKQCLVQPLIEYFWNTKQSEIFLNSYQQKRAFAELHDFEEKLYFESLRNELSVQTIFSNEKNEFQFTDSLSIEKKKQYSETDQLSELQTKLARDIVLDQTQNNQENKTDQENVTKSYWTPDNNTIVLNSTGLFKEQIIEPSRNLQTNTSIQDGVWLTSWAKKRIEQRLQQKTIELAIRYNTQSIEAMTNCFADLLGLIVLCILFFVLEIQINITKSFLLEVFFGLDDSKKSLLILLITDLLVGYHSSNLWEFFFQFLLNHYGLPENQTGIFLLVATFPVLLDVLFKYLIFRHLNRASPATVATYHAMIE